MDQKRVRFDKAEIWEFKVGHAPCCVPESGGPPIGLVGKPLRHYWLPIDGESDCESDLTDGADSCCDTTDETVVIACKSDGRKRTMCQFWVSPFDRAETLMRDAGLDAEYVAEACKLVRAIQESRSISRWDERTEPSAIANNLKDFALPPAPVKREKIVLL